MARRRRSARADSAIPARGDVGPPRPALADPTRILLALAALAAILGAWSYPSPASGIDFYQFWWVGRAAVRPDTGNVYSAEARVRLGAEGLERARAEARSPARQTAAENREVLQTSASPLLYTLFGVFSSGRYDADLWRYRGLSLACSVLAILGLGHLLGYSPAQALAALVVFAFGFEPLYSDLRVGNVNQLQLGMLAAYLWSRSWAPGRRRDLVGGFLLGFAVLFKPNLAIAAGLLGLSWLFDRDFRSLRDHALGGAGAVAVALALSGAHFGTLLCWSDWIAAAAGIPDENIRVENGNVAPAMLAFETWGVRLELPLMALLLGVAGARLWRTRAAPGSRADAGSRVLRDAVAVAAGAVIYLLGARLAWLHYHLLAVPALLIALRPAGGGPRATGRRLLALAALLPLARSWPVLDALADHPRAVALAIAGSTLLLYALLMAELRSRSD